MTATVEVAAPPADVRADLARLATALDDTIPAKSAANVLIATWNLRAFAGVTPRWRPEPNDSPRRAWDAIAYVAEITSRFDVVALQEVRRDTSALRLLLQMLGPDWRVIASDVTEGDAGNGERLAYLYDTTRVQASGLVGEIVLPPIGDSLSRQFARTPYVASFSRSEVEFVLATVHVIWGDGAAERVPEIAAFANWMRAWVERGDDWNANALVLGDFNLDRLGNPLFDAFVSTGLWPPSELAGIPRTIFHDDDADHFYDQIAWFAEPDGTSMLDSLTYTHRAGSFDFVPLVLTDLTRSQLSWRMSDHYPLWAEFDVA
ncbi:endonuclease/exonuclease/phosphatase family protein [Solicola gregarius]|uniref:Endonuclease/exonuclease/phosphatase family protein n=1 Tax=Solicola gregarius TaxID=2908642 RepID=A0AA46YJN4_9ACTN|nr:endonuclease/exonuclease/phosphatase family protein [Solicola gregarius]UYM04527.1 endonuclease/exonuclease/phosphatase family protein [Solicola gregarius]